MSRQDTEESRELPHVELLKAIQNHVATDSKLRQAWLNAQEFPDAKERLIREIRNYVQRITSGHLADPDGFVHVPFAHRSWRILARREYDGRQQVLLLLDGLLKQTLPYHNYDSATQWQTLPTVTWNSCTLRLWLNSGTSSPDNGASVWVVPEQSYVWTDETTPGSALPDADYGVTLPGAEVWGDKGFLAEFSATEVNSIHVESVHTDDVSWTAKAYADYLAELENRHEMLPTYNREDWVAQWRKSHNLSTNDQDTRVTFPGGTDIECRVFLLDMEQCSHLLKEEAARIAQLPDGRPCGWWLRSPGSTSIAVAGVNDGGWLNPGRYIVRDKTGGVRPALWLNLD
jgi:hypothetical protein